MEGIPLLKKRIGFAIFIFVIWFLLSGKTEAKFIILGAVTAILVSIICTPMLHTMKAGRRYYIFKFDYLRMIVYFFWLFKEIILSSFDVMKAIISPKDKIHFRLLRFACALQNPAAVVLFMNSITLTPGTITIDIEGNEFVVNALTETAAEGLLAGTMQKKIAELFHEDLSIPREERDTFGEVVKKGGLSDAD